MAYHGNLSSLVYRHLSTASPPGPIKPDPPLPLVQQTGILNDGAIAGLPCLERFPVELQLLILQYLDLIDLICLALTHPTGKEVLSKLVGPPPASTTVTDKNHKPVVNQRVINQRLVDQKRLEDRKAILCRLARDLPQRHLCSKCVIFHPCQPQDMALCNERFVRLTGGFSTPRSRVPDVLPWYIIQGLMRMYARSPMEPTVEAEVANSRLAMTWRTTDSNKRQWQHAMSVGARSAKGPLSPQLNRRLLLKIVSEATTRDTMTLDAPDFSLCHHMSRTLPSSKLVVEYQMVELLKRCEWALDHCRVVRHRYPHRWCEQCRDRFVDEHGQLVQRRRILVDSSSLADASTSSQPPVRCVRCSSVYVIHAFRPNNQASKDAVRLRVTRFVDNGPVGWHTMPEQFIGQIGHPDYVEFRADGRGRSTDMPETLPETQEHPCWRATSDRLDSQRARHGWPKVEDDPEARDMSDADERVILCRVAA